jgi:hypothetical protein
MTRMLRDICGLMDALARLLTAGQEEKEDGESTEEVDKVEDTLQVQLHKCQIELEAMKKAVATGNKRERARKVSLNGQHVHHSVDCRKM